MAQLPVTLTKDRRRITVEVDRARFERLASTFGLFSASFLASLDSAEADVHKGRVRRLHSLRDLRTR